MAQIVLADICSVIGLADRQRHDRQGRIFGGARGELAAVRDEQVLDVVRLSTHLERQTQSRVIALACLQQTMIVIIQCPVAN